MRATRQSSKESPSMSRFLYNTKREIGSRISAMEGNTQGDLGSKDELIALLHHLQLEHKVTKTAYMLKDVDGEFVMTCVTFTKVKMRNTLKDITQDASGDWVKQTDKHRHKLNIN